MQIWDALIPMDLSERHYTEFRWGPSISDFSSDIVYVNSAKTKGLEYKKQTNATNYSTKSIVWSNAEKWILIEYQQHHEAE
jgi:hypothetical protein